jgi:hypothetical protein
MVGVILFFAGLMFLIENSGDPFHNYQNAREPGSMRSVIGGHQEVSQDGYHEVIKRWALEGQPRSAKVGSRQNRVMYFS